MDTPPLPALPLPLYESHGLGTVNDRAGKAFDAYIGLSESMVAKLKERSLDLSDTELQENSSDYKRFGEGSYESWYGKGRTPFALIDPSTDALAAIAWLGPKPLGRDSAKHLSAEEAKQDERLLDAGDWHTVSFRSYPGYRGTGLMKGFLKLAVEMYKRGYPGAKIWGITDRVNEGSARLLSSLGLVEHASPESAPERLVMVEP